ncbi:MAG TPA: hypothetical protein VEC14_03285 [Reyranellaceae bacterium]|nr:hypothetical protein [Reyranellaceae bacterium]
MAKPASRAALPTICAGNFHAPATRRNAFTLLVVRRRGAAIVVAVAKEWVGTSDVPLRTKDVMREIALTCRDYGVTSVATDQYLADSLRSDIADMQDDNGKPLRLNVVEWTISGEGKAKRALKFRDMLSDARVELARTQTWTATRGWHESSHLALDLRRVRRTPTPSGIAVKLPQTPDGRHCDFWPPMMMAMGAYLADPRPTTETEAEREARRMREQAEKRFAPRREEDW